MSCRLSLFEVAYRFYNFLRFILIRLASLISSLISLSGLIFSGYISSFLTTVISFFPVRDLLLLETTTWSEVKCLRGFL